MNLLRKALNTYEEDGLISLLRLSIAFLHEEVLYRLKRGKFKINGSVCRITSKQEYRHCKAFKQNKENTFVKKLQTLCKPDDIFLDVGACNGLYTISMADQVKKVIAVEPHPANHHRLMENIGLNKINNVEAYKLAITDSEGPVNLLGDGKEAAGHGSSTIVDEATTQYRAYATTLDNLLEDAPNIIKIDIEGAELQALRGAERILNSQDCRLLLIEVHPNKTDYTDELKKYITSHGFDIETFGSLSDNHYILCRSN